MKDRKIKLIVGLGNPGPRYAQTKHNVGFRVIDALYEAHHRHVSASKHRARPVHTSTCRSIVAEVTWHDLSVIFAKPMTYMNDSGTAVAALLRQFEVPLSELCIVYDDVHLAFGTLRLRQKGRDGGQKGMRSIIQHLGTTEFPRLRIGIGKPLDSLTDHVLTEFSEDEEHEITHTIHRAVDAVETFIKADILTAMNQFNGR